MCRGRRCGVGHSLRGGIGGCRRLGWRWLLRTLLECEEMGMRAGWARCGFRVWRFHRGYWTGIRLRGSHGGCRVGDRDGMWSGRRARDHRTHLGVRTRRVRGFSEESLKVVRSICSDCCILLSSCRPPFFQLHIPPWPLPRISRSRTFKPPPSPHVATTLFSAKSSSNTSTTRCGMMCRA